MDIVIVPSYVSDYQKEKTTGLSFVSDKFAAFRDTRYIRDSRHLATIAALLSTRLRTWFNATDYFSNTTTLYQIADYQITLYERLMMTKRTPQVKSFERAEWKGFVEHRLNDAELQAADDWEVSDAQMWEMFTAVEQKGYKLTVSYSAQTGSSTATMIAGNEQGKLSGWALSARGANGLDALKLLFYKHFHSLDEKWDDLIGSSKPVQRG